MRTTALLSILAAVTCFSITRPQPVNAQQEAPPSKKAAKKAPGPPQTFNMYHMMLLQPDMPILVGDGSSIHFQKENGIVFVSGKHATAEIDTGQAWGLRVYGCVGKPMPAGCTGNFIRLGDANKPWQLSLYHTDQTPVLTISFPDKADAKSVSLDIPIGLHSTFSQVTGSGGTHVAQSSFHLSYAMVNGKKLGCPPATAGTGPGGTGCQMEIGPSQ